MTKKAHPRKARGWGRLLVVAVVLAGLGWLLDQVPLPRHQLPARQGPAFAVPAVTAEVSTTPPARALRWGYQLQDLRTAAIPEDIDLLVVDYSQDGTDRRAFTPTEVQALRQRPGRPPRIVLAYLSIGEAESYRYYWWPHWNALGGLLRPLLGPAWLGPENPEWAGNFPVRYWQPGWQRVILEPRPTLLSRLQVSYLSWRKPYLDRILEAGFDGVYLDRVDAYDDWAGERPTGERDMADFVKVIASYARSRKPGFLIVPQNGEELLGLADYREVVDGLAKEDLLFGVDGDGTRNGDEDIRKSIALLQPLSQAGKPVLVVEYLRDPAQRAAAARELAELGFPALFAERSLSRVPEIYAPAP